MTLTVLFFVEVLDSVTSFFILAELGFVFLLIEFGLGVPDKVSFELVY